MGAKLQAIKQWLLEHPWVAGLLLTMEVAGASALCAYLDAFVQGHPMNWNLFWTAFVAAEITAVRNWFKQNPPPIGAWFGAQLSTQGEQGNMKKILPLLILCLALLAVPQAVMAQDTSGGLSFSASSDAIAFHYLGEYSTGTKVTEQLDFYDFGANKTQRLSVAGFQILAPTPAVNQYLGGVRFDPDLTKWLSKTNVSAANLGVYLELAAGTTTYSTSQRASFTWLAGGGIKYRINNSLTVNTITADYVRIGNKNAATYSLGLKYVFGPH